MRKPEEYQDHPVGAHLALYDLGARLLTAKDATDFEHFLHLAALEGAANFLGELPSWRAAEAAVGEFWAQVTTETIECVGAHVAHPRKFFLTNN